MIWNVHIFPICLLIYLHSHYFHSSLHSIPYRLTNDVTHVNNRLFHLIDNVIVRVLCVTWTLEYLRNRKDHRVQQPRKRLGTTYLWVVLLFCGVCKIEIRFGQVQTPRKNNLFQQKAPPLWTALRGKVSSAKLSNSCKCWVTLIRFLSSSTFLHNSKMISR